MSNVRILIIEDEAVIAQDIHDILLQLGYDVAAIINHCDKAVDYLSFHSPDLVLCDINIKGSQDGIDVAEKTLRKKKIPFIYLTSMSDRSTIERAKKTMPYGYIVKPFDERDLLTAIEMALFKFSQEVEKLSLSKEKLNELTLEEMTDQEYQIVRMMTQGLNNEKMCKELYISKNTLKYHLKNIMGKFEAGHRGDIMQKIISKWMLN